MQFLMIKKRIKHKSWFNYISLINTKTKKIYKWDVIDIHWYVKSDYITWKWFIIKGVEFIKEECWIITIIWEKKNKIEKIFIKKNTQKY